MACIRYSILLLVFIASAHAQTRFSSRACLDSHYKMRMIQKGPLFGLLKHEFVINKKACDITVTYRKYFPREWKIDVCREPVHIKVTSATGVDVAKKINECINIDKSRDTSDFCSQYFDLIDVIQDEGLIFAEGDRDDLNSDHGKTYCTYLLFRRYLFDSVVFSRYTDVPEIFEGKPMTPVKKEGPVAEPVTPAPQPAPAPTN